MCFFTVLDKGGSSGPALRSGRTMGPFSSRPKHHLDVFPQKYFQKQQSINTGNTLFSFGPLWVCHRH